MSDLSGAGWNLSGAQSDNEQSGLERLWAGEQGEWTSLWGRSGNSHCTTPLTCSGLLLSRLPCYFVQTCTIPTGWTPPVIDFSCCTIRRLTLLWHVFILHPHCSENELMNVPLRMNLKSSGESFTGLLKDQNLIPTDSLQNHTHIITLHWLNGRGCFFF